MGGLKSKFNFSELTEDDFLSKTESIIKCMEGKPDFPSTIPSTAEMLKAFEGYKAAMHKAMAGGEAEVNNKKAKRAVLEKLLLQLPAYSECSSSALFFKRTALKDLPSRVLVF